MTPPRACASLHPLAVVVVLALATAACGTRSVARPVAAPAAQLGVCGEPGQAGVLSARPDLRRADRDLDGDGAEELVAADRGLCREGNCYWNIFSSAAIGGCRRYLGTVAGAVIDRLGGRGEDGFHDLRGWWRLADGERQLLQEYRFRHGAYRINEAMVCRQKGDDRLTCAREEPAARP
jgi:hypothetical protein